MEYKEHQKETKLLYCIIVALSVLLFMLLIMRFSFNNYENEYNKAIENPPTIDYIEEDAEFYLMSTMLEVVDVYDEGDYIIYTIYDADTENYYKVSYKIESHHVSLGLISYKWVYNSHIYLGKELIREK